jgi:hypothetical protein
METAMPIETFETKRTPEGVIDVQHYARHALAERRAAKSAALRKIGRGTKRAALAIVGFFMFWNIPPLGSARSNEMPYR